LGEVLQEVENSLENPNRKLPSKENFIKATKEAKKLLKKAPNSQRQEKPVKRSLSKIDHLHKRQSIVYKIGPEFQINSYNVSDQMNPSAANLTNSKFVVIWDSNFQDGDGWGLYGQIHNYNGTKYGSEFQVNTYTIDDQRISSVRALNDGRFVVAWESLNQDGNLFGVYAQVFNADGTKDGAEFLVNTYIIGFQKKPSVVGIGNDQLVVVWYSYNQDGDSYGIFGQRFYTTTTKVGVEFPINTYTNNSQTWPYVESLKNNRFVVSWDSIDQDGDGSGVYAQIFNNNATKYGSEFQVNTYTINSQAGSVIACLSNSKFVIAWVSTNQDGDNGGVYGQIFNEDGTKYFSEFQVNTYTTNWQGDPSIASLNFGRFVIAWSSSGQNAGATGVYAQVFNADGTKYGLEFKANTYRSEQTRANVISLTNDEFFIAWDSNGQDGSARGVFGQFFGINHPTSPTSSSWTSSTFTSTSSTSIFPTSSSFSTIPSATIASLTSTSFSTPSDTSSSPFSTTDTVIRSTASLLSSQSNSPSHTIAFQSNKESQNIDSSDNNISKITIISIIILGSVGSLFGSLALAYFLKRRNNNKNKKSISLEAISVNGDIPSSTFESASRAQYDTPPVFPANSDVPIRFGSQTHYQAPLDASVARASQHYQATPVAAAEITDEMVLSGKSEHYQMTPVGQDNALPVPNSHDQHYRLTPQGEEIRDSQHYQLTPKPLE